MNKISRLWALVITIAILALGAVVANSTSPSSAEGGCAGKAYVTNQNSNNVSVIDTATNAVVGSPIPVGTSPEGVAITPNGAFAYVANQNSNSVSVINTATNAVVGSPIAVGNGPAGVAITPNGAFAYVTNFSSNSVSVINTATNAVVGSPIPVGTTPQGVAICPAAVVPPTTTPTDPAVVLKFTG